MNNLKKLPKFSELTDEDMVNFMLNNLHSTILRCDVCESSYTLSINSIKKLRGKGFTAFGCTNKAHRSATVTTYK